MIRVFIAKFGYRKTVTNSTGSIADSGIVV